MGERERGERERERVNMTYVSICFNTFIDWSLPCLKASRHEICADLAAGSQSRGNRLGRKMVQNSEAQMGYSETPKMDEQWIGWILDEDIKKWWLDKEMVAEDGYMDANDGLSGR